MNLKYISCAAFAACAAAGLPLAAAESYRFDDVELGFNFTVGTAGCSNRVVRTATPADMKTLKIDRQGTHTELTWKGHAVFGPDFTVVATLDQTGKRQYEYGFRWSGSTNGLPLQSIAFPRLVVPRTDKALVFNPNSNGCVVEPDWKACRPGECVAGARPRGVHFTATLEPSGTSWYLDQRGDARIRTTMFDVRKGDLPDTAVLKSVCEMPNEPAPSGALPFTGAIARFTGDSWFDAAAIYRDWVRTQDWHRAARARDLSRLRDIGMWFWNRGRADHVIAPVERFQKDSGVPCALDWYWWHNIPYDTCFPNFWPPREGEDVFRAAVERCKKSGIFIQVYTNGMTWDWDDPSWSEGGAEGVLVKCDGTPRATAFNRFNHHRLAFMCGTARKYQTRMRTLYRTLAGTGLPGIYLDMIGNASYEPCYAKTHGHVPGGGAYNVEGNRAFVRNIQKDIPGVLLCTEDPTEAYLEVFESGIALMCNYERFGAGNDRRRFVPAHQAVYHGCAALFGSYAMVHGIPPFDEKWPTDGKWKQEQAWERLFPDQFAVELTRGVVWGMQPMVHNFLLENATDPRYADDYRLMVDTARFYHANRDLLFDGEMLSPGRLDCATKKADFMIRGTYAREGEYRVCTRTNLLAVMHGVWRAPNGRTAAVLFNWTREPQTFALETPEIKASGTIPPRSWKLVEKFRGSETARGRAVPRGAQARGPQRVDHDGRRLRAHQVGRVLRGLRRGRTPPGEGARRGRG